MQSILRDNLPPVRHILHNIHPAADTAAAGGLWLLSAGWRSGDRFAEYADAVQSFDWPDFYRNYAGEDFFEWFRTELLAENLADVVLIDSRTGVTEMGGVCTQQLADVVVAFCAANIQNLSGIVDMARSFVRKELLPARNNRPIDLLIVPSRLDQTEGDKLNAFKQEFLEQFKPFVPQHLGGGVEIFWEMRIPYVPYYAFREALPVREPEHPMAEKLIPKYEYLARIMARCASSRDVEHRMANLAETGEREMAWLVAKANTIWEGLPSQQQNKARDLFTRFARLDPDQEGVSGVRSLKPSQLDDEYKTVVDKFVAAGVLEKRRGSEGEAKIRLVRAGLFDDWGTLRQWVEEDRDFLLWRQRLGERLGLGQKLRHQELKEARRWRKERKPDLTAFERELIDSSRRRQTRQSLVASAAVVTVGLVIAWVAFQADQEAKRARVQAVLGALVATWNPLEETLLVSELKGLPEPEAYKTELFTKISLGRVPTAVLIGHSEPVRDVAFSPDGRWLVTGSMDGTARVWSADGKGNPLVLSGHHDQVRSVAFSPDGQRILTGSWDGTARIWNADGTGDAVVLRGHWGRIYAAEFSPDGQRIVTGSGDKTAGVWTVDGMLLRWLPHKARVYAAAFSPNGRRIATASWDGTARLWSVGPGTVMSPSISISAGSEEPLILAGHAGRLYAVNFSPDSRRIVTASGDRTARIWNTSGYGKPIELRGHEARVYSASFSPDGRFVVTASKDGTARLWNVDGSPFQFEPSKAGSAREANSLEIIRYSRRKRGAIGPLYEASVSPNSNYVVTAGRITGRLVSIDPRTKSSNPQSQSLPVIAPKGQTLAAAFSADGSRLATASDDGSVSVWTLEPVKAPDGTRWSDLIAQISALTTACLTASQRERLLRETPETAEAAYKKCERRYDRTPALQPSPISVE